MEKINEDLISNNYPRKEINKVINKKKFELQNHQ